MTKVKLLHGKLIFVIAIGFVLLIAILIVWLFMQKPTEVVNPDNADTQTIDESYLEITSKVDEGDVDGALNQYDEVINKQNDEGQKKRLLIMKSELASRSGKIDVAIDAAQDAEKIEPDATVAQALATAYELNGDKENAVIYYKKLIELTPVDSAGERYLGIWQAKIKELEQ